MPYTREISSQNKALFVFLLDQSLSMEEPLGGSGQRKMDGLVTAVNAWLQNIAIRATGSEGVKDWMDIAVLGYRTDSEGRPIVESQLSGALAGKTLVSIAELAEHPAAIEEKTQQFYDEETGELIETPVAVPVWVKPLAEGGTPMCNVLHKAYEIVTEWIDSHPNSFPPIVLHITDGESQDGDPIPYAEPLMELATDDGNVLLFNCHLSDSSSDPIVFPHSDKILPDELARVLFQMSSILPERFVETLTAGGFEVQPDARGMTFNADMPSFIEFLDMGTRVASNLC